MNIKRRSFHLKLLNLIQLQSLVILVTCIVPLGFADQTILVGCDGQMIGSQNITCIEDCNLTFQGNCNANPAPLLQSLISQIPAKAVSLFDNFTINPEGYSTTLNFTNLNVVKILNTNVSECPQNGSLMKFENVSEVGIQGIVVKDCNISRSLIIVKSVGNFSIEESAF